MSNKETAKTFLKMVVSGDIKAAYEKFVATHMIHHNQYFQGDRQSLMSAMIEAHEKFPKKIFEIKNTLEDGPLVMTHSYLKMNAEMEMAVMHMFRFDNGKIVEMWDLGQPLSKDSPNKNGAF